jgi:hypothetical protein
MRAAPDEARGLRCRNLVVFCARASQVSAGPLAAMAPLVFIDTNILLDFYRARGREGTLSILNHIDAFHDRIITSAQVEMEYKKNRQAVILDSLKQFKTPDWNGLSVPAFLAESQPRKNLDTSKKSIDAARKKILARIDKVLTNPSQNDTVYRTLQRLFKADTPLNLSRAKQERFRIRRLALKRFLLGYPPRKAQDTSYGDSVNWEWIVDCATRESRDVVVVSRDSDYGVTHGDDSYLNDWLADEFKKRVGRRRKCHLKTRLTEGFKIAGIQITRKEIEAEEQLVRRPRLRPASTYEFQPAVGSQPQNVTVDLSFLADIMRAADDSGDGGS